MLHSMNANDIPSLADLALIALPIAFAAIAALLAEIRRHLIDELAIIGRLVASHEVKIATLETVVKLRQLDRSPAENSPSMFTSYRNLAPPCE